MSLFKKEENCQSMEEQTGGYCVYGIDLSPEEPDVYERFGIPKPIEKKNAKEPPTINEMRQAIGMKPIEKKNDEGYQDPTAYDALSRLDEEARFHRVIKMIFGLLDLAGFYLDGRITIVSKKTGRTWR